ncbi:NAD(+) kinase [Candidatus Bathyarchaeota archaeon]|nr:NAD(+) kinase [Candidatus Bathyarchaeota archaeon]NIV45255.1 NAD(+) kinase [Candidatus Bathyarchaeota archaeon]
MLHTVGLVARVDRKKALDLAARLSNHLEKKGLTVFLEPTLSKHARRPDASTSLEKMKTDLIITVGGDGTILNTCLQIPKPEPPILAINMGVRGFLAEATPKEAVAAVDKCLRGDFTLERCSKLASFIGKTRLPDALNEVFITSLAPAKLLHMRIWKNGVSVADCRSDGAVIASQVGSTGYSLSAGGPVLDPDLDAFVFTPICPLTIFHPIVFSTKSSISVELRNPKRALVVLDGHYKTEIIPKEARIVVVKSEHQSAFVRFNEDFYRRLKGRLLFSRGVGS